MFIFEETFQRTLAGAVMGGFEEEKKEWNHVNDNPSNLRGEGKWEKTWRTNGNGKRKMKYH